MAQRSPLRPTSRIEEAIGFVGMFGILFLGVTVFCELTGRPALGWALVLLACVLGVVALDRWRVSVLRRTAPADDIGGLPAVPAVPVRRAGSAPAARAAARTAAAAVGPDGRVHRHVGWDELGPGGRRPTRTAGATATRAVTDRTTSGPAPTVARAQPGHAAEAPRPSDG